MHNLQVEGANSLDKFLLKSIILFLYALPVSVSSVSFSLFLSPSLFVVYLWRTLSNIFHLVNQDTYFLNVSWHFSWLL